MSKALVHYLLICIVGTIVVTLGSAGLKMRRAQGGINRAVAFLNRGDPAAALLELQAVERTASLFPECLRRLDCAAVACHARMGDAELARRRAQAVYEQPYRADIHPANVWETLLSIPQPLLNAILARSGSARPVSRTSGYEVLATELKAAGAVTLTNAIPRDVLASLAPPAVPAPAPTATASRTAAPAATRAPAAPAAAPAPLSADGVKWGVAASLNTRCYDTSGKFLRKLSPGTVFEIGSVKTSSAGDVALCTAMHPGNLGAPILIPVTDLHIYEGALASVPAKERALKAEAATLSAEIAAAKTGLNSLNPNARRYQAARDAHNVYWAKVKDLQAKRDGAHSGPEKMELADKLRMMKGDDIRLGQELEAAKKQYDAWNAQHPNLASADPAVRNLETELARVQDEIRRLPAHP